MICGRRGGKTFSLTEELLTAIANSPHRGEVAYIGPTHDHAFDLMWEPLEDALQSLGWKYKAKQSRRHFLLPGRRKIYIIGAEKISRIVTT